MSRGHRAQQEQGRCEVFARPRRSAALPGGAAGGVLGREEGRGWEPHLRKLGRRGRGGFTLLELTVVLAILTTLALLAVRETGRKVRGARRERSDALVEGLAAAVRGEKGAREGSYVSDVGRLPRAVAWGGDTNVLTLGELYGRPEGVAEWGVREAYGNLSAACGAEAREADRGVWVGSGWRGPYWRNAGGGGAEELKDGWGVAMTSRNEAGWSPDAAAGERANRLLPAGFDGEAEETAAMVAGTEVAGVRHLGANGLPDPGVGRTNEWGEANGDRTAWFTNCAVAAVTGSARLGAAARRVGVRIYGPETAEGETGKVRAWEWEAEGEWLEGDCVAWRLEGEAAEGLTAGRRVVRAWSEGEGGERYGRPTAVELEPGENWLAEMDVDREQP